MRDLPFELWERIHVFAKEPHPCAVVITMALYTHDELCSRMVGCSQNNQTRRVDCAEYHQFMWPMLRDNVLDTFVILALPNFVVG